MRSEVCEGVFAEVVDVVVVGVVRWGFGVRFTGGDHLRVDHLRGAPGGFGSRFRRRNRPNRPDFITGFRRLNDLPFVRYLGRLETSLPISKRNANLGFLGGVVGDLPQVDKSGGFHFPDGGDHLRVGAWDAFKGVCPYPRGVCWQGP